MEPGKLDTRITIKTPTQERTDTGGVKYVYYKLATVWAEVRFLKGRELIAAAQKVAQVEVKFTIRYSSEVSGVSPKDIVSLKSIDYDILSALPVPGGSHSKEIEILAKGRAPL